MCKIKIGAFNIVLIVLGLYSCNSRHDKAESNNMLPVSNVEKIIKQLSAPQDNHVLVAAHRGDWFWAPENSLKGFSNCIEIGVDMLEIDVRLSKDSVPVIMHDPTLNRTTNGSGNISDWTLDSLKTLYLKDAVGVLTKERIPTLEEVLLLAKNKILVYLDKSSDKVKSILPVLEKTGTTNQTVFVLDFPLSKAKEQFGTKLDSVIYIPAVEDKIENLENYFDEYLADFQPKAFQFRIADENSISYKLLDKVKSSESKIFIAATWANHTIGHDDQVSRTNPDNGWGWLINEDVRIMETNRPYQLLEYLRSKKLHD